MIGDDAVAGLLLANGLRLLDEATGSMTAGDTLPGQVAFKLYDTFGFPYDLTEDALRAQGFGVDRAGFDTAMGEQKAAARAAWKGSGSKASEEIWFDIAEDAGVAHGAAHDPAKHIAPALVSRQHAVGNEKARGAQMIGDNAVAGLLLALGPGLRQLA